MVKFTEKKAMLENFRANVLKSCIRNYYFKLDDVSSETIGLHQVNGGVVTSHAIRVTSHMTDGAECCVATRPIHKLVVIRSLEYRCLTFADCRLATNSADQRYL